MNILPPYSGKKNMLSEKSGRGSGQNHWVDKEETTELGSGKCTDGRLA
jgi:hypothetical protein